MKGARLIVVSNRLPVTIELIGKQVRSRPSCGGLVSALWPVFKRNGGCWIGWPGTGYDSQVEDVLLTESACGQSFAPVFLTEDEQRCFYGGWSNEIIWPLFHDLPSNCKFDSECWLIYREANEKFADVVEQTADRRDFVWVHDYHLMMLADSLRSRGMRSTIAYFHHIPFPSPDMFEKLPWRREILRGLLQFTSLGFQTERDSHNFVACVRRCFPEARIERPGSKIMVRVAGFCASVGTFPISVDFRGLESDAASVAVEVGVAEIRQDMNHRKLILGLDRLDYTKGVPERLAAFRRLLEKEPSLRGHVNLLQVVVPSRESLPRYRELKESIERLVGEINRDFGTPEWTPVSYWYRRVPRSELLALYRAADVAFLTPLKDGMNLVAKEFCASRMDGAGVLVLSEFAGAAVELRGRALLVNPYDTDEMAAALLRALSMGQFEQRSRMLAMRRILERADVFAWCRSAWRDAGFHDARHKTAVASIPSLQVSASAM